MIRKILIPLVIIIGVIVFILFYLNQHIWNVPCSTLKEKECQSNDKCQVIYGPSSCSGNICTSDMSFGGCQEIPSYVLEKVERDKKLCNKTGGKWDSKKYAKPGRCDCYPFIDNEGCTTEEEDCSRLGGTFYKPGTLKCDDHLRATDSYACGRNDIYATVQRCICPNGKTWSSSERCS